MAMNKTHKRVWLPLFFIYIYMTDANCFKMRGPVLPSVPIVILSEHMVLSGLKFRAE